MALFMHISLIIHLFSSLMPNIKEVPYRLQTTEGFEMNWTQCVMTELAA